MSRLSVAALSIIALVLVSRAARADDAAAQARVEAGPRWNLDARLGYAASWTTGQSYLALGAGLAAGLTLDVPIHFEVGALYHGGSTVMGENATIEYWSRNWSVLMHAAGGYQWTFAQRFLLRPQAIIGCVVISDEMRLGDVRREGFDALFVGGVGLVMHADLGGFHAGLDLRALSVPSRIASPIGGIYAAFGGEL
jgi:hypothetical protein